MTLDGLERVLAEKYRPTTKKGQQAKVHLTRYADDFVISGCSKELLEREVQPLVVQFLRERGLELSSEKTVITQIEQGFDFLGQNIRKYQGTLLIKPSKANKKGFLQKVRKIISVQKQTPAGELISLLNPLIRGWALYHRHVASKRTFSDVDHAIFEMLWRWAKRRHPNKDYHWIKEKYFHTVGDRQWVFSGEVEGQKGTTQVIRLYEAAKTAIERHRLIKGEANPYDPVWETYFEQRMGQKWQHHWLQRRKLIALWKEQEGKCPVCQHKITKDTGWRLHFIDPRVMGGRDIMSNLLILHSYCHDRAHIQKMKVTKPGAKKQTHFKET